MHSRLALKLFGMIKNGIIKSNAMFWREFCDKDKIDNFDVDLELLERELQHKQISLICVFDDGFPNIQINLKASEKPFFFAYKGNIKLLSEVSENVAVIGVLTPTKEIEKRERRIVQELVKNDLCIVSGLARGCDTVAHRICLECGGKTIAILPTTFDSIYPKENGKLVDEIVNGNGLILTEYVSETQNKFERINRFIFRDRLQAMFSTGVILIASYAKGYGDSGARHAMQKAKEYNKPRFVMFNEKTDDGNAIFELNKQQIADGAKILTNKKIKELGKG